MSRIRAVHVTFPPIMAAALGAGIAADSTVCHLSGYPHGRRRHECCWIFLRESPHVDLEVVDNFGAFRGTPVGEQRSAWARRSRHPAPSGLCGHALASRAFRRLGPPPRLCWVAGWGAVPNFVVARAAVPDFLARPFSTRPSLLGATQPAVVPIPTIMGAPANPNSSRSPPRRSDVTLSGWNGTTSSRVGIQRSGLVADGRAPRSGTAAHATTKFGSSPHPATPTSERSGEPAEHTRKARAQARRQNGAGCRERRAQAEQFMIRSTP